MSGHRNFKEPVAKMLPERRMRVKAEADDLHREYVLPRIRQQVGFTQADVNSTTYVLQRRTIGLNILERKAVAYANWNG